MWIQSKRKRREKDTPRTSRTVQVRIMQNLFCSKFTYVNNRINKEQLQNTLRIAAQYFTWEQTKPGTLHFKKQRKSKQLKNQNGKI